MRYLIYCDESDDKGSFYSNFYGGALLKLSDQAAIEARLKAAKGHHPMTGEVYASKEFKWTKVCPYMEANYIAFVQETFALVREGLLKIRIMFTQNINNTDKLDHDEDNGFFILYYHFLKHAFGLHYCNDTYPEQVFVHVALDEVPGTQGDLANFKKYLSGLSDYPLFFNAGICIPKASIYAVNSKEHVILQAVDVVLGSIQFRLNDKHLEIPKGERHRAKRTRAKERVFKEISRQVRAIYPNFNIGTSTASMGEQRWTHPYAHWLFVSDGSVKDLSRGKAKKKNRGKRNKALSRPTTVNP
jgi:hypothetical protein